jgi:ABC-type nitrate/sulfonate/bicarbonate transport system permease component
MSRALSVFHRIVILLALPAVLFAIWYFTSDSSTSFYFPPLRTILSQFHALWLGSDFGTDVIPSVERLLLGYVLASVFGVALGVLLGLSRAVRTAAEPVLEFLRAIPPPVLVPVLLLIVGFGDTMRVTVIITGSIWPILLNTVEGVKSVDSVLSDTCATYGIRGWRRLTQFVVPSAAPQIVAGMRTGLSIAIILMVISEMFAATSGLGAAIILFQQSFAIPEMWSGVLALGLIGFAAAMLFELFERAVLGWYEGLKGLERQ